MNINLFKQNINKLLNDREFLEINITFGFINRNGVMSYKINSTFFERFKSFIEKKNTKISESVKEYYHNNMILISKNNKSYVCIKKNFTEYQDYFVQNKQKYELNYSYFRLELQDYRLLDLTHFPSVEKYDNIIEKEIDSFLFNFKKSEILLQFINEDNIIPSIVIKSKIDANNLENFINNFQ